MKHDLRVTLALIFLFLASQFVGLGLLYEDADVVVTTTGDVNITHAETVLGPRPDVRGQDSFILVIFSVLIGTGILLALIKFGKAETHETPDMSSKVYGFSLIVPFRRDRLGLGPGRGPCWLCKNRTATALGQKRTRRPSERLILG